MLRQITILSALLIAITVSDVASAQTLPPEAQARILITKVNKALANKDNEGALVHLQEMNSLQVERPVSLYVVEAQLAAKSNKWTRSKKALDLYFQKAPPTDSGYDKAAALYVIAEEKEAAAIRIAEAKKAEELRLANIKAEQARLKIIRDDEALWLRAKNGGECGHIIWYIQESKNWLSKDAAIQHAEDSKCELDVADLIKEARKKPFKDCNTCPEMVVVPAGSFVMGSPSNEKYRDSNEDPQRTINIAYDFAVGKYEVTWTQWEACVADGACEARQDKGWGKGNRPVINVSWNDAKAYAKWLSDKTGHTYRLLSEAEWEYAARAGSNSAYPWGSSIGRNKANCDGCGSQWGNTKTAPVGSFSANAFGLYDMHGNVWEWVEDWYKSGYSHAPSDGRTFTNCSDCFMRVGRGGSWDVDPRSLRSANRDRGAPSSRVSDLGFRLAKDL